MLTRNRSSLCLASSLLIMAASWSTSHAQRRPAQLDPGPAAEDRVIQILPLRYVKADKDLLRTLQVLLSRDTTLAMDERTNSLIIQSDEKQQAIARNLLETLDAPAASEKTSPANQDRTVRIVWLMTDIEEGARIPDDMMPIVEELSRYGVEGLRLVTQTIVRGRGTFTTSAYPDLDGNSVVLQIDGTFVSQRESGDKAHMEISLSAKAIITPDVVRQTPRGAPPTPTRTSIESLAQLETTVLAPFGHPVVLCMTPVKKRTSVFIVQVLLSR